MGKLYSHWFSCPEEFEGLVHNVLSLVIVLSETKERDQSVLLFNFYDWEKYVCIKKIIAEAHALANRLLPEAKENSAIEENPAVVFRVAIK